MKAVGQFALLAEIVLVPLSLGLLVAACGLGTARIPWPRRWFFRLGAVLVLGYALLILVVGLKEHGLAVLFGLVAVRLVARFAAKRPTSWRFAVPLAVFTALTFAQPFGVRANPLEGAPALTRRADSPSGSHTLELFGLPVMRFALHQESISHLGLGECCPPQNRVKLRSWILVPGVMTNGSEVTELNGDGVPSDWELRGSGHQWDVSSSGGPATLPDDAWSLEATVTSAWGVGFWVLATAGIAAVLRRRRRSPDG